MTLIEQVRERFESEPRLQGFLPMLNEYIFPDDVLIQLRDKSVDAVFRFCAERVMNKL